MNKQLTIPELLNSIGAEYDDDGNEHQWSIDERAEALNQISDLGLQVIGKLEEIDHQDELAHDKYTRNDLREQQRKAWHDICFGGSHE